MKNRDYTSIFRVMHWAMALCLVFILLTIFLRLTWMNKDHVADIIQAYLSSEDKALSRENLITLAKQIRKPMWDWHLYTGYVLAGLFFIRLSLPLFGHMKFANPLDKHLSLKVKFQYWVYLVFYACLCVSLLTGLIMEFGPKSTKEVMEEIHVLSIYYLIPFLILHLGGVLLAEFTTRPGIISSIIRGTKEK